MHTLRSRRVTVLATVAAFSCLAAHILWRHRQAPIDEQYARALVGKWRGGGKSILTFNTDYTFTDAFPHTDDWSETQVRHATWQVCDRTLVIQWVDDPHDRDIAFDEIESVGAEEVKLRFRFTYLSLLRIAREKGLKRAFNYWKFDDGARATLTRVRE